MTTENLAFEQALARARAREAKEIADAIAGNGPRPSRDIGEMLRQQAEEHLRKVLASCPWPVRREERREEIDAGFDSDPE